MGRAFGHGEQRTEDRGRKTEDKRQRTENGKAQRRIGRRYQLSRAQVDADSFDKLRTSNTDFVFDIL